MSTGQSLNNLKGDRQRGDPVLCTPAGALSKTQAHKWGLGLGSMVMTVDRQVAGDVCSMSPL